MIYPNSYNLTQKEEPYVYKPEAHKGTNKQYTRPVNYPRVYHKYLNTQTRAHIYGEEESDSLFSNVKDFEFEELNANQIDFLIGEQRK